MPPVAILAGGLATRLRPHTATLPKALVSVAGEPFIAHQLRLLRRQGIDRVVLCVAHLGEMIRDFVGDGQQFGLDVAYSFDGPVPMGTGGALLRALQLLGDTFFVLYGDSYLDINLTPILVAFHQSRAPSPMTVLRNEGRWDTSNVLFDDARVVRQDLSAFKIKVEPNLGQTSLAHGVPQPHLVLNVEHEKATPARADQFAPDRPVLQCEIVPPVNLRVRHLARALPLVLPVLVHQPAEARHVSLFQRGFAAKAEIFHVV